MRVRVSVLFVCFVVSLCVVTILAQDEEQKAQPEVASFGDEAFQAILQFYQYDKDIPLDSAVVEKIDRKQYLREKIVLRGANDYRVPGYLAIPKAGKLPYPCVLQIHGMTLSKEDFWESNSYHKGHLLTQALLDKGIAVFALDAQYHGERSLFNDFESTAVMLFKQKRINRLREMVVQTIVDYRKAIDYLETRKEIDLNRIGVIGYSLGGSMSFVLGGVDSRIKVIIACVSPTFMRQRWTNQHNISAIAPFNFVRAIKGRPLLMLMGRNDDFNYTVEEARALYDLIEGESKEIVFYDSKHRLPEEHISKALEWFKDHLQ
jgi:dipeptidyl aminopeptidase/acylaminoacyl peptidase